MYFPQMWGHNESPMKMFLLKSPSSFYSHVHLSTFPNASFYKWNSTTLLPKAAMGAEVPSSPLAWPSQLSCLFPPVSDSLSWGTFCLLFPLVLPSVHETKIWASAPEYSNTGTFQRNALDNWNIENVTNAIHLLRPLLVTSWLQSTFSKTIHSKKKACKD